MSVIRTTRSSKSLFRVLRGTEPAVIRQSRSEQLGDAEMGPVAESLATMGMEQVLLAIVFVGSYALALGEFAGARGRLVAVASALLAAAGFAAFSHPWEAGVILVASVPVGMGLFAGAAWMLWAVATWRVRRAIRVELAPVQRAPRRAATGTLLSRMRARLRFV